MHTDINHSKETNKKKIVCIPILGEGLYEVKLTQLFKKPNEKIEEDEVIYEIETDKTIMSVESPNSGTLIAWLAKVGDVLQVGSPIAEIAVAFCPSKISEKDIRTIPPKSRAYCKKLDIKPDEMLLIPIAGKRLMPSDVDSYLLEKKGDEAKDHPDFREEMVSKSQQKLINRFVSSQKNTVPASLSSSISIKALSHAAKVLYSKFYSNNQTVFISPFQVFAYCVAKSGHGHPKFRSILISNNIKREFHSINLGIAVNTNDDELAIIVIPAAGKLAFPEFIKAMQDKMESISNNSQQLIETTPHVILSYMGEKGVISGSPLLVEPSVAVLFLGSTYYLKENDPIANVSMTFDHRLINGMDALKFIQSINNELMNFQQKEKSIVCKSVKKSSLEEWLLEQISNLLTVDPNMIILDEPLGLQGLNSIMATQLAAMLSFLFKTSISPSIVWHYPTYQQLLSYLTNTFNSEKLKDMPNSEVDLDVLARELQHLSDMELDELMSVDD